MKKVSVAAALVLSAISMSSFAGTADQTVNVTATLTSQCRAVGGAATLAFGTYTAFRATPLNATAVDVTFECTRSFASAPTVSFGAANGVVAGLLYTIAAAAPTVAAGSAAVGGGSPSIGTATTYVYNVSGQMAADQAGTSGASGTDVRTMTITY